MSRNLGSIEQNFGNAFLCRLDFDFNIEHLIPEAVTR
jgi:hypothetical protein